MRAIKMLVAALALQGAIEASAQTQLFHPTNAVWRYNNVLVDQQAAGADWITAGYNDSAWLSGHGLFGNEANYPYPMNTTGTGFGAGLPQAIYYRSHFTWSGSTVGVILTGTNYVDDGSIIYLNGVEIARFNMAPDANAATPESQAPAANPGGFPNTTAGEPALVQLQIDLGLLTNGNANPLITGDNVVAVQVHQNGTASSDRVFGLALYGSQAIAPCFTGTQPTNRTLLVGRSTTFVATETCGVPAPAIQWYRNLGGGEELITGATAATYTLTNANVGDTGNYYAKAVNSKGTATSPVGRLTVTADNVGPVLVSARLGANTTEIIARVDETLCTVALDCGNDSLFSFNWEIVNADNPLDSIVISSIALNGLDVVFTLDGGTPWVAETRYTVKAVDIGGQTGIGDLYGNLMLLNSSATTAAAASAISVKATGLTSDLYTFDVGPSAAEFATFTWAGGNGDVGSADAMDTAVNALDGALIVDRLAEAAGDPPGTDNRARYASDTKTITTRPTGVIGNVVKAHLRNDTGAARNTALSITYTLADRATGTAEEVPGHYVYFSFSGSPNSWTRIPEISGDGTPGTKTGVINLSVAPWAAGADMYILFADDNAVGTEGIYEIDNFRAFVGGTVAIDTNRPALVRASGPNATTIVLTFSERMAASAATTAPYSVSGATVTAAALNTAGTEVTLTTSARAVGNSTVTITGLTDASAQANLLNPSPTTFSLTTVLKVLDWAAAWEYNTNNLDSAPTWKTTGGTGWLTGNGLFGTETSAAATNAFPTPIATEIPPPNTNNTFLTSYFRKSVTLPALSAGQSYAIGHYTDDGAIFYIDGNEVGRINMPAGPVTYTNLASVASTEGLLLALPFTATAGNHVLAVEVHQSGNTSSDMVFGAEVIVVPTASPRLDISQVGTNALVRWNSDTSWALFGSANVAGPYAPVAGNPYRTFSRAITTPATQFYKLDYIPQP